MADTLPTAAVEAARDAMKIHGIDIALPWEGDLDDLETERFDALCAGLVAARQHLAPDGIGAALAIVRQWLQGYEDEEKTFGRYTDDAVLDGIMTAAQRRSLSAALTGEP